MTQDNAKRAAAEAALAFLPETGVVGLGTGSTARYFIEGVGRLVAAGRKLTGVPTSAASRALATAAGIPLLADEGPWTIDVCVDGADEVTPQLSLIKGLGGALLREKIVNQAAQQTLIVVDRSKCSERLGQRCAVPIEVTRFGHAATAAQLQSYGQPTLRVVQGQPFLTDGGNYIYDVRFSPLEDPAALDQQLQALPGVVETGFFLRRTSLLLIADEAGVQQVVPIHVSG